MVTVELIAGIREEVSRFYFLFEGRLIERGKPVCVLISRDLGFVSTTNNA